MSSRYESYRVRPRIGSKGGNFLLSADSNKTGPWNQLPETTKGTVVSTFFLRLSATILMLIFAGEPPEVRAVV
jgi:hypothetical protein